MSFVGGDQQVEKVYGKSHPQQQLKELSFVENVIIAYGLPLSSVDNENFLKFCHDLDPKFRLPSRTHLSGNLIPQLAGKKMESVKVKLASAKWVAVTLDIWTDRRCHSFLGVTAHTFVDCTPETMLIKFVSFHGSHTGVKIAEQLDIIMEECGIKDKVSFFVTDSAANMLKAMHVMFEQRNKPDEDDGIATSSSEEDSSTSTDENNNNADDVVDDSTAWEDLSPGDQSFVDQQLAAKPNSVRLACFAHSLQLVVKDGLGKVTSAKGQNMKAIMGKCVRMATMCHQSALFRGSFEDTFGTGRSIPAANSTRWNSTYTQMQAVCKLDQTKLNDLLRTENQGHLALSSREYGVLKEFVTLLEPFAEATQRTQGDSYITISCVVPSVIGLYQFLSSFQNTSKYHGPMSRALMDSLSTRFAGLLTNVGILDEVIEAGSCNAFGSMVYLMTSLLDPSYGFVWINDVLPLSNESKLALVHKITEEIVRLGEEVCYG